MGWEGFDERHFRGPRRGRLPRYAPRPADFERPDVWALAKRDGWTCAYCGEPVERKDGPTENPLVGEATIDHVVPRIVGGGDTLYNAVLACSTCNTRKGRRYPSVMFA